MLRISKNPKHPKHKIQFFITIYQHLHKHIHQNIIHTNNPIKTIKQIKIKLNHLTKKLTSHKQKLTINSHNITNIIHKTIQHKQNHIHILNQKLQNISFNQINNIHLNINIHKTHTILLNILSKQHKQHQNLFNNNHLTFSKTLTKLYQHLNPQINIKQHTPQTINKKLLNYHNYLKIKIKINHNSNN